MSDERTETSKILDSLALGIVSTVLLTFGIIAFVVVFHLAKDYPAAVSAVGGVVLFVWALMRVLNRYSS